MRISPSFDKYVFLQQLLHALVCPDFNKFTFFHSTCPQTHLHNQYKFLFLLFVLISLPLFISVDITVHCPNFCPTGGVSRKDFRFLASRNTTLLANKNFLIGSGLILS